MIRDEFRAARARIMQAYAPYSSENLGAMIADCRTYVNQSLLLRAARRKIKKTGDRAAMFVLWCERTADGVPPASIAAELERVWLSDLRFDGEAHLVEQRAEGICLDFVTWWEGPDGSYVTGTFVVAVPDEG